MARSHPASFAKRAREAAKRAKRQEKAEKRAARRSGPESPEDGQFQDDELVENDSEDPSDSD